MKKYMKPSSILKEARRRILEDGWAQGSSKREGKYCAWGALLYSSRLGADISRPENYLAATMKDPAQNLFDPFAIIIRYNDKPRRRKETIIKRFDEAIELAESEGK